MVYDEEFAFVSCLLSRPELLERVASRIKPEYLYNEECRLIYSKMNEMGVFTLPTLAKELKGKVEFPELLKIESIISLSTKSTIDSYAYVIMENFKREEAKHILATSDIEKASTRIDELKNLVYFDEISIDESQEYLKLVEDAFNGRDDLRNIKTGFQSIDKLIKGFRKSELIVIGGRPGSGKTTIGMNIAYNMAVDKKKVLFASIEMGVIELHERLVRSVTKINNYKSMSVSDFEKIVKVSQAIKERLPLKIYDKPGMKIEDIIYQCKKMKDETGIDCLVIDHLSILSTSKNFHNRYETICYLTQRLKALSREFDIPVILLCQLNRALEGRDIKAPNMSDLRDSGSIEQDADLACFVYRPEYHLKDREPDDKNSQEHEVWERQMAEFRGKAQFIVAKNRRGNLGRVDLGFDGANYSFMEHN